ncbi:MAG: pyridoxal-phosphate dependent enzyme, partial [Candidatus Micrarchaeota archaeon]|nr:pyridoxal-phosphate dependent enzyme [Candidatus Micrarchaeota archaeon]
FDEALALVRQLAEKRNYYVLNSVNPWRLEGQKTIIWEALMQFSWRVPDWIVVPAGNVGNTSAFGKALLEAKKMGWIDRLPRLAAVQAQGANALYQTWSQKSDRLLEVQAPETIASAIRIGKPVNWQKALKYLTATNGVVEQVSEQEIMDAKAVVDAAGIGCEPASAACVAGAKKLAVAGTIAPNETVLGVLTGHVLKDPDATVNYHLGKLFGILPNKANPPVQVEATLASLEAALG